MKFIQNILDSTRSFTVNKEGKKNILATLHGAIDTLFFVPAHTTHSGSHIRDSIDMKRTMMLVIIAMVPAIVFGFWNIGDLHYTAIGEESALMANFTYGLLKMLPMILVTYAAGLGVEIYFAFRNGHEVNEGFFVSGMLIPMIMPVDIPLWMVAISTIFAVVLGKEVFGGTGMNILNPALLARAFAFFAYPVFISGDKVWVNTKVDGVDAAIDGFSGATPLGELATTVGQGLNSGLPILEHFTDGSKFGMMGSLIGNYAGSVGETSAIAILIGAVILIATGIGSWRIMLSMAIGGLCMGLIFNAFPANDFMALNPVHHLLLGGFMFGMVFMATDPVSASQTNTGKYIYGFLTGFLAIMIRVFNPAYPEGVMMAILFMNVMAPLIDHYVVGANVKRRLKRVKA